MSNQTSPLGVQRLAHACIHVADLDRSLAFYCETLGFAKKFDFIGKAGDRFGAYIELAPETFLEIFCVPDSPKGQSPVNHFCLEVADIDAAVAHLKAKGVELFVDKKMGADHSWQAWFGDPDGTRIELHHYTDKSSQLTGADCHADWR
ncbi:VOC family protein [Cerasicoccus fimbriatus]|uniref:VOC family protein n=1 Tax=Cerasicoccus fimbriatus TaxID=3014554 RepID=UPI0022B4D6A4|nr:VOC family protein [Cerasicoccus sp. TK19100]